MGLHTLQLSYRPRRHRVPQVVTVAFWGLAAWGLVAVLGWALAKCVL